MERGIVKPLLSVTSLLVILGGFYPCQAFAGMVTISFDLVKVSARAGPVAGEVILSVEALGDGPFKTKNGAGPFDFLDIKPNGNRVPLNNFTNGAIVANQFQPRYFGSVAAAKGAILRNLSNIRVNADS